MNTLEQVVVRTTQAQAEHEPLPAAARAHCSETNHYTKPVAVLSSASGSHLGQPYTCYTGTHHLDPNYLEQLSGTMLSTYKKGEFVA